MNPLLKETRLDDHLRGEFHSGAPQLETIDQRPLEAPHAAVDVMNGDIEHSSRHQRKHRIAEPPVQPGHRTGSNRASARGQATALYQVVALSQLCRESWHVPEVVAVVC